MENEGNSGEVEDIVNCCIESYYALDAQVKSYGVEFGKYLMLDILQEIVVILTYSFFMFMWGHKEFYVGILGALIPLCLYSSELYMLATSADKLQTEAHKIVNVLNFLPFEKLSTDVQAKVHLLAIKVSASPPRIEPCSYFTLNRNLVTSVITSAMDVAFVFRCYSTHCLRFTDSVCTDHVSHSVGSVRKRG